MPRAPAAFFYCELGVQGAGLPAFAGQRAMG